MAQNKRGGGNRRLKKGGGRRPLMYLVLVILLIGVTFFLLEKVKKREGLPAKNEAPPSAAERYRVPERPPESLAPVQKPVSSAVLPPPKKEPARRAARNGTVALIIDDMGSSVQEVRSIMAIGVPVSFSIIPGLPKMKEVATEAREKGYQVMIHIPMEPKGYPHQPLEKNGLLLAQSEAELTQRVRSYFQLLPQAVGANNHMGSSFTENEAKMRLVVGLLKEKGLFFVDSRTSPRSVGSSVARSLGVETASRDVFLDNVQDVSAIRRQLDQLAATARRRGSAIGICHPHKTTIEALVAGLPALQKQGIAFVPASELVR